MQPPRAAAPARRTARLPRNARRLQLLRAAQDVFVAQGFHAAAMDDIAVRAGVSKPVLYQHFPGKRELYLALLEEHVGVLAERVGDAMSGIDDNRARVDAAVRAYFDFIDAEGEAFRLVFESDLRNDGDVRATVDRGTRVCVEAIAEVIAADTGADAERALLLASGLTGLAETSARWWLPRKGTVSRDEAVSLMSSLAWRGISGFPRLEDAESRAAAAPAVDPGPAASS
ncbi:TetR/AcrR family transcriptional regulator [Geodermatophilus sp. YIM 151500]|uniref:TetR/AcrR family transcriptional regulator n=1 Tax=Geodermatophilus sp. YIM 151500 TaxID=2984531 RepID=UPI0021E4ABA9|nr:TetR/AcrR family transcriptional regulator [Geodermatophilus sp. YIM 151500]MCV2488645.1 TetR/AcrR family transcriptional regulator [Geodermatophilus sp. YIM 151500]